MPTKMQPRAATGLTLRPPSRASHDVRASSSLVRRAVARVARRRWFAALGRRLAPFDRAIYRASAGRLTIMGPQGAAMPATLLLTTTGRRSGKPRATPVMYLRDGERIVITSENFGQEHPAAWPLNLAADASATIQVGGHTSRVNARRATGDEISRYWPRFVEVWPPHESYRRRSGVCNMFVLTPIDDVRAID
jgi:deazaflavin-dependent oxidoreductase (nitroreductase family)